MRELSPILEIAKEILTKKNKPMSTVEITRIACEQRTNLGMTYEDFKKKLDSALNANTKTLQPSFQKVRNDADTAFKKGWYKLKKYKSSPIKEKTVKVQPVEVSTGFTGKAGEYSVMSELLFWGFNVSLMSVDEGIDVIASKNNKFFYIQVKTANVDSDGKFKFTIDKKSRLNNSGSNTFYIFLMRANKQNNFAIVPDSDIEVQILKGLISGENKLNIVIHKDVATKYWYLNKRYDITTYINNFPLIK